jgi:hypothetical protein
VSGGEHGVGGGDRGVRRGEPGVSGGEHRVSRGDPRVLNLVLPDSLAALTRTHRQQRTHRLQLCTVPSIVVRAEQRVRHAEQDYREVTTTQPRAADAAAAGPSPTPALVGRAASGWRAWPVAASRWRSPALVTASVELERQASATPWWT